MTDTTQPTSPDLTMDERYALLALMTLTREASNADLENETGITIGRTERERMVDLGLVATRQDGRTWMHELTDKGWRRAEEELASPTPEGAPEEVAVLYGVTRSFAAFMARSNLRVADIFTLDDDRWSLNEARRMQATTFPAQAGRSSGLGVSPAPRPTSGSDRGSNTELEA